MHRPVQKEKSVFKGSWCRQCRRRQWDERWVDSKRWVLSRQLVCQCDEGWGITTKVLASERVWVIGTRDVHAGVE